MPSLISAYKWCKICTFFIVKASSVALSRYRSSSCSQVHFQSLGSPYADWSPSLLCHPNICHHWPGVLHRSSSQNMLQYFGFRYILQTYFSKTQPDDIKLFNLDTIVRDGMNTIVPCSAEPPESAPSGAYLCNVSEAICLEKWNVSHTLVNSSWY